MCTIPPGLCTRVEAISFCSRKKTKRILNISLAIKLPIIIATAALVASVGVGLGSYIYSSQSIQHLDEERLTLIVEARRQQLDFYFSSVRDDLKSVATDPITLRSIVSFSRGWKFEGEDPSKLLYERYVNNNPHPVGQKQKLNLTNDGVGQYVSVHRDVHPWFRQRLENNGYYDIFLFEVKGNLIYSVAKESDYSTNFSEEIGGEWANTGLGQTGETLLIGPDNLMRTNY